METEIKKAQTLQYGENPHQQSILYLTENETSNDFENMSHNNCVDADAAFSLCNEISSEIKYHYVCSFIKHTNSCGTGISNSKIVAYEKAYLGDPNAAMGGILACNFEINSEFANSVMETYSTYKLASGFFIEVLVAPSFSEDAISIIKSKKTWGQKVRLLKIKSKSAYLDIRSVFNGKLVQSTDIIGLNEEQWEYVTQRIPTDYEKYDLRLAWLIAKHTKSNAISICKDGMLIGNGAGQMSRVMSCRVATWLAKENGHNIKNSVAASDAFFPFSDGPELLIESGVTAIIQPGGSKRDSEVINICNKNDISMIFTGTRHFKH